MKKLILFTIMLFTLTIVSAETLYYRTTDFAFKIYQNGEWSKWSDWIESDCRVNINLDSDKIIIFSNEPQIYKIIELKEVKEDKSSGQQIIFRVIDQDDDYGDLRLRKQKDGNLQLYVDFADIMWVYNIKEL